MTRVEIISAPTLQSLQVKVNRFIANKSVMSTQLSHYVTVGNGREHVMTITYTKEVEESRRDT